MLAVGGCGSVETRASEPRAAESVPTPAPAPTGPPWPAYGPSDYTYDLALECFCADVGVRYRVVVRDGAVESVVYAARGRGHVAGQAVQPDASWLRVTINDIIELANNERIAEAQVDWPTDQEYPRRVWIDRDKNTIDEEIGYVISRVTPA